jgi:hypothetical protein
MNSPPSPALFLGTYEDRIPVRGVDPLTAAKSCFGATPTFIVTEPVHLLTQLEMYCAKRNITKVISTNTVILRKLLEKTGWEGRKSPSLSNYSGSIFTHGPLDIVFVNPVSQVLTVPYGKFIFSRFASKVLQPQNWKDPSHFSWSIIEPAKMEEVYAALASAYAIAEDIETKREQLSIRCVSFTGIFPDPTSPNGYRTHSYCLPIDSDWAVTWYRKISALPVQKIFQNGQYDNAYKLRYGTPTTNWMWDTCNLFHSWYSELPKDLAFLNAYFLRKVVYWKDMAETSDLQEYYRYNCMDSWATANVWIEQMRTMPDWARRNYVLEFPLVFPCLLSEMTGLEQDQEKLLEARATLDAQIEDEVSILRRMLHSDNFNVGSPKQVLALLNLLGSKVTSTEEKDLKKAALTHPLISRIVNSILSIRGKRKLVSTYLRLDEDATAANDFNGRAAYRGRIFYSLKPSGTDTARLASQKSAFWCGLQIQNIPRGEPGDISYTKTTICASSGFVIAGVDLKSAETYDTAYISGCLPLMEVLNSDKKFHAWNASKFFGIPYEVIYCKETGKTLLKEIYDISKRVNHGFNYNMGWATLVDTMGEDRVWKARTYLKLPTGTTTRQTAEFLLNTANTTYPEIRRDYYPWVIKEVTVKRMLVSRAVHWPAQYSEKQLHEKIELGDWTRYTFLHPDTNKLDLNSLVAHCPQSLNARTLNEAYMQVFYEIALPEAQDFRLHAQIHDEILCSFLSGRTDLLKKVQQLMQIPVAVRDVKNVVRVFSVPASLKAGPTNEGVKYWSDVE